MNKPEKLTNSISRKMSVFFFVTFKRIITLFRSVLPKSQKFGFDRGGPINHYYIEKFIEENSSHINGTVLEIADSRYSKKFGKNVERFEVLHYINDNPKATIVADLTKIDTLPENFADCFICTQTLNFIYDFKSAIKGMYHLLKPGGILLATVSGISQISRYDMDQWGDYWRFTTLSCEKIFKEVFGEENVKVDFYGNCLSARMFLNGQSSMELTKKELDYKDNDYQVLITIKAHKKLPSTIKATG
ncbi:MAG: methyltransferase 11 protein [Parcubacteria group bacterium]|nr:methyltransferase 11 protein [Parcubacteria group bacterium]